MKASEFRDMSEEELKDKVQAYSEQLFKLRLQQATGQLDNVMKIREVRRDLARTKTVLTEKEKHSAG
jgi:large subunit ribosomal protein L29